MVMQADPQGLPPAPTQRDHAHVRGPLQSTRPHCGLLVDRLSSSRIPASRARRMTATPAPSGSASLPESLNSVQR
jgi:hypothetical protein